jgi:dipeptidyl aminopeptidase/acylaminoacyl peptidase
MRLIILILVTGLVAASAQQPRYPDKANLLVVKDDQGKETPIRSIDLWRMRRRHILADMQLVMGPLPDASRKVPLDVQVVEEVRTPNYLRRKLTFAVEKGDRVPAYLLLPHKPGPHPAVLCLHQTTKPGKAEPAGLAGDPSLHYAHKLAERGFVTLAPDYPGYGEYKCDPYALGYASATMKGIWNHMRAVDLLASLPEVDAERIGVIGHSLGGHNSLFVAAFDERLTCIVSNCGFCSFPKYYQGNLAGWSHQGYMPRIRTAYGLRPERMPFDFPEVVAALAPRPFLAIAPVKDANFAVDGVRDCMTAARPVYQFLRAADKLAALYPDAGHAYTPGAWEETVKWLEKALKK